MHSDSIARKKEILLFLNFEAAPHPKPVSSLPVARSTHPCLLSRISRDTLTPVSTQSCHTPSLSLSTCTRVSTRRICIRRRRSRRRCSRSRSKPSARKRSGRRGARRVRGNRCDGSRRGRPCSWCARRSVCGGPHRRRGFVMCDTPIRRQVGGGETKEGTARCRAKA